MPELREDAGEIELAECVKLPRLVELSDMRGDLHTHTRWSDAVATVEEMAEAARARGYAYLAITDHSPSLVIANGLTPERLRAQKREIEGYLGRSRDGIRLLNGVEVDILKDGRLDLNDVYARMAKERGVKLVINSDAHSVERLDEMIYGVWQARRAGLEPSDVVNCMPLEVLERWLARRRE